MLIAPCFNCSRACFSLFKLYNKSDYPRDQKKKKKAEQTIFFLFYFCLSQKFCRCPFYVENKIYLIDFLYFLKKFFFFLSFFFYVFGEVSPFQHFNQNALFISGFLIFDSFGHSKITN